MGDGGLKFADIPISRPLLSLASLEFGSLNLGVAKPRRPVSTSNLQISQNTIKCNLSEGKWAAKASTWGSSGKLGYNHFIL